MDYELNAWLAHGGPDAAREQQIRALFDTALTNDQTGLQIREENGLIRFTHQTVVYLLEKRAGTNDGR